MNSKNIPTYYGKKWTQATVGDMIENEKYKGDVCGQKIYIDNPLTHKRIRNYGEKEKYYIRNHHEAIVSPELWEKAQEVKKKEQSIKLLVILAIVQRDILLVVKYVVDFAELIILERVQVKRKMEHIQDIVHVYKNNTIVNLVRIHYGLEKKF